MTDQRTVGIIPGVVMLWLLSFRAKLPFDGLMDDVVIYNRALGEDEINQLASGVSPDLAVESEGKIMTTWAQLKGQ